MSITKADIKYRILKQIKEFKPLNNDVNIQITTEEFWEEKGEQRDHRKTLIVRGVIKNLDKDRPVEWRWVLAGDDGQLLNSGVSVLAELKLDYRSAGTLPIPVEREISIDVNTWLRVGLLFIGHAFGNAYVEFTHGGEKVRANVQNLAVVQDLAGLMHPPK